MQVASVTQNGLAIVKNDAFVLIGEPLARQGLLPDPASMIDFMAHYDSLKSSLEDVIAACQESQSRSKIAASAGAAAVKNLGRGVQL